MCFSTDKHGELFLGVATKFSQLNGWESYSKQNYQKQTKWFLLFVEIHIIVLMNIDLKQAWVTGVVDFAAVAPVVCLLAEKVQLMWENSFQPVPEG